MVGKSATVAFIRSVAECDIRIPEIPFFHVSEYSRSKKSVDLRSLVGRKD